ncbi:DUF2953 domain-containing protein [Jeotgalibacillus soli]|nr:DUF2953 domain-containing protein [Jeotgalibacillus soli]
MVVHIRFNKTGEKDFLKIKLKLFNGLYRKRVEIPLIKSKRISLSYEKRSDKGEENKKFTYDDVQHIQSKYEEYLQIMKNGRRLMETLIRKVSVDKLQTEIRFGVNEADWTAYITSFIWTFHSWLRLFFEKKMIMTCTPQHSVYPLFGGSVFQMQLSCMFSIRLGHLIKIGILYLIEKRVSNHRKAGGVYGTSN